MTTTDPTTIDEIDLLTAQRDMLIASPAERERRFIDDVMGPIRPIWEPMTRFQPAVADTDPALTAAAMIGIHGPAGDSAPGLTALDRLADAGTWDDCLAAVRATLTALDPAAHGAGIGKIRFALALGDPAAPDFLDRQDGTMGIATVPGWVYIYAWPTGDNLARMPGIAAHETHHRVRLTFEPWKRDVTVGQYLVLEGLAEAFVAERYGGDHLGPWTTSLDSAELGRARAMLSKAIDISGYDRIFGYIFGDWAADRFHFEPVGVPDFAGYAVGYDLVRAWQRETGRTAVEGSWLPWRQIISESRYFEH